MARMPRSYLFAVAAVAIPLVFALLHLRGNVDPSRVGTSQVETSPVPERPVTSPEPQPGSTEKPKRTPMISPTSAEICSSNDVACLSNPFAANSEADVAWMRRHGYPIGEEASRLKLLSENQLENEISGGSLTAMTELAGRKIERSDWSGLELLTQASDRGSIYSNYVRSSAMLKKGAPMAGIIESGAYLRLAYILGDYKAADALQNDFLQEHSLTPREMSRIDERAASLYRTYARNEAPISRPQ